MSLKEWESFYVITGSSAAALTGLMFVVVALVTDRIGPQKEDGVGAFSTPTVVHFSSVLLVASIMAIPSHSVISLRISLGACAVAGLMATVRAMTRMQRLQAYAAVVEDWVWHIILPLASYLLLLAGAVILAGRQELALVFVAVTVLALLFIGIHNAWDIAVYIVTVALQRETKADAAAQSTASAPAGQAWH